MLFPFLFLFFKSIHESKMVTFLYGQQIFCITGLRGHSLCLRHRKGTRWGRSRLCKWPDEIVTWGKFQFQAREGCKNVGRRIYPDCWRQGGIGGNKCGLKWWRSLISTSMGDRDVKCCVRQHVFGNLWCHLLNASRLLTSTSQAIASLRIVVSYLRTKVCSKKMTQTLYTVYSIHYRHLLKEWPFWPRIAGVQNGLHIQNWSVTPFRVSRDILFFPFWETCVPLIAIRVNCTHTPPQSFLLSGESGSFVHISKSYNINIP